MCKVMSDDLTTTSPSTYIQYIHTHIHNSLQIHLFFNSNVINSNVINSNVINSNVINNKTE